MDGDGYDRSARLNWDPDVVGCIGTLTVFEKVWRKPTGSSSWTLVVQTPNHVISGCPGSDSRFVDIIGQSHFLYDFKIDIFRADMSAYDYTLTPVLNPDLNDYALETASEDSSLTTISATFWTNAVDFYGDGYKRSARLNWNPDVVGCSGTATVFEKVWRKPTLSTTWTLVFTGAPHAITGCSNADMQFLNVIGQSHYLYDWKIDIFRSGMGAYDYTRNPGNDANLNDYPLETAAED